MLEEQCGINTHRIRALVIEDDPGTAEFVRVGLSYEGFDVTLCTDGLAAVRIAQDVRPGVVVLDWMLPGLDGLEVCRRLRARSQVPILMLTGRDTLADRVLGLENGADDYLVKPFRFEQLVACIRNVLSGRETRKDQLQFADIRLDPSTREVYRGDRCVDLTPREFDLLQLLLEDPGHVFSKQAIVQRVWGYDYAGDDNIVEVYVGHLRDKLDDLSGRGLIRTMRGAGYALCED